MYHQRKCFPVCILAEWTAAGGPGEILQLPGFVTEPLFWRLLCDGGPRRFWHPAKCLRLAATLEAVIMAHRRLATRAPATPHPPLQRTDIIFLSRRGSGDRAIISPAGQRSEAGGYFGWRLFAVICRFALSRFLPHSLPAHCHRPQGLFCSCKLRLNCSCTLLCVS